MTFKQLVLIIFSLTCVMFGSHTMVAESEPVRVNINTATTEELAEALEGVGESKAVAIVEHREKHGSFQSLQDLRDVKGIGQTTLEVNAARIDL